MKQQMTPTQRELVEKARKRLEQLIVEGGELPNLTRITEELKTNINTINLLHQRSYESSWSQYRNELIIQKAKSLVLADHSIKEVSNKLGYSTSAHFVRFFTDQVGLSPLQWKKKTSNTNRQLSIPFNDLVKNGNTS